jgi:hypothetical protein
MAYSFRMNQISLFFLILRFIKVNKMLKLKKSVKVFQIQQRVLFTETYQEKKKIKKKKRINKFFSYRFLCIASCFTPHTRPKPMRLVSIETGLNSFHPLPVPSVPCIASLS